MVPHIEALLDKLNPEQRKAATLGKQSSLILSVAGSGKTSTLTTRIAYLIDEIHVAPTKILAVTFTNKAAKEMLGRLEKIGISGKNLWVGTFHGICNRVMRENIHDTGYKKGFNIMDTQEQLSFLKRVMKNHDYDTKTTSPESIQYYINQQKEHGVRASREEKVSTEERIYGFYENACKLDNCVDFSELLLNCYELFLNKPHILDHYAHKFEYILVDEFQDTNKLQYKWLRQISSIHKCIFAVGDDDQCLPEGTMVATPQGNIAIENIQVGQEIYSKIGTHMTTKTVMNKFIKEFEGELIKITLENGVTVSSTPEHTWFAGYSKAHSPQKYFTYLMYKNKIGFRIGISRVHSGSTEIVALHQRAQHEHADKMWIISCHESEDLARYDEIKISLNYGIPTVPFVSRKSNRQKVNTVVNNQELLEKLFSEMNTESKGLKLLQDLKLDFNRPVHIPCSRDANRNNITLTLCGERREERTLHTLEFFTNNEEFKTTLKNSGFKLEDNKRDNTSRIRINSTSYGALMERAKEIESLLGDVNIIHKAKVHATRINQIWASHILPGMMMIDYEGKEQIVSKVEKIKAKTTIYDLNIENTHNFFANGICTHNSIYSFRGAEPQNMKQFLKDFDPVEVIKLEKNYRSYGNILKAANSIIAKNQDRQIKELKTELDDGEKLFYYEAYNDQEEAGFIAEKIKQYRRKQIPFKEMAILYRTNAQSRNLEKALTAHNIPFVIYGGFRFFDRQEVKHAMAYLRLVHNKDDNMAFLRVINFPTRGIGSTTVNKIEQIATEKQISLWQATELIEGKAREKVEEFKQIIVGLQNTVLKSKLPLQVERVLEFSGLEDHYKKDNKDGPERLDNLYELISAAEVFIQEEQNASIEDFLAFSSLESDINSTKRNDTIDAVKLMTVHAAKGLEFELVFISGLDDGLFPHGNNTSNPANLEEERRLMYVAVTRAKQYLFLTRAEERLIHGQREAYIRSRFLSEIPRNLIDDVR
jgi:DNA helicase II / ATP-dependent DNA helicase PcrA